MRAPELKTIAAGLAEAGAPGLPTVVLVREVPLFEVEFAALEFAEEAKLPSSDWAVLALARALGELSPADVDGYLGLGEAVSDGILRRLVEEALLEERSDQPVETPSPAKESAVVGFFRRLFRSKSPPVEAVASESRTTTAARRVRESLAPTAPLYRPTAGGARALEHGAVLQRRVRPARLLFLAKPLLFLGVLDEKRQRHTQHRRSHPLEPERVPDALRVLDTTFALPTEDRLTACGIERSIREFPGQFVGIVPGTQWEVRPFERKTRKEREPQRALLVLAAFPSSDASGLRWRAYLRQQAQTHDCPHVDGANLVEPELRSLDRLLASIEADEVPNTEMLRSDGAFELRCGGALLSTLLGEADRPDDTFVPALATDWWVGFRVHALPLDLDASHAPFYELLGRRDAALRRDFDGTCADVAESLIAYWGENPGLPSADEAAIHLWARGELRAALCMRRRHRDLVAPYENDEGAR